MNNMELENKLDAIALFKKWFNEAKEKELRDPNAMQLATVSTNGYPSVRTVLLKDIIKGNFIFYTNYRSRKANEILETRKAALCFYWKSLNRQVRVVGKIEKVSNKVSDKYFESRSLGSRAGAWASLQSKPLQSRKILEDRVEKIKDQFGSEIPRPKHWGGFKIIPNEIEFWKDGNFRLHDRFILKPTKKSNIWESQRLYP